MSQRPSTRLPFTLRALVLALGILAVSGAQAAPAKAYEDQATLFLDLGYAAVLANPDLPTSGVQLGLGGSIGLTDAWTVRARGSYGLHPASTSLHVATLGAEVYYVLDILKFVPFFGLGLDGVATIFDGGFGLDLGLHAVVGLDWLVSREWVVGLDIRPYVLPFSLASSGVDPVYLTVDLRVSFVFDR